MAGKFNVCAIHGFTADFLFSRCPYCDIMDSNVNSLEQIERNTRLSAELCSVGRHDYSRDVESFQSIASAINSSESAVLQELEWGFMAVCVDLQKMTALMGDVVFNQTVPTQLAALEFFDIARRHQASWVRYRFSKSIPERVIKEEFVHAEDAYKVGFEDYRYRIYYPAYIQFSVLYLLSGRPKDAIEWLERSLAQTNSTGNEDYWTSFSWRLIGRAHYVLRDFSEARDALKNALDRTKDQAILWYDYAKYCALGQDEKDKESCLAALSSLLDLNISYWSIIHRDRDFDCWRKEVDQMRSIFLEKYREECLLYCQNAQESTTEMVPKVERLFCEAGDFGRVNVAAFRKLEAEQILQMVRSAEDISTILSAHKRQDEFTDMIKKDLDLAKKAKRAAQLKHNIEKKTLQDEVARLKSMISQEKAKVTKVEANGRDTRMKTVTGLPLLLVAGYAIYAIVMFFSDFWLFDGSTLVCPFRWIIAGSILLGIILHLILPKEYGCDNDELRKVETEVAAAIETCESELALAKQRLDDYDE